MKLWQILLGLMLYTACVSAEPLTIGYTEPTASGTLLRTTIYWCYGATCSNWREASRQPSDNGNGGDAKSFTIPGEEIKLTAGTLPITIRVRVSSTNTSGNESAGAFGTHTFTAP